MNIFLKLLAGVGFLSALGGSVALLNKNYSNDHKISSDPSLNGSNALDKENVSEAKDVDVKRQPPNSFTSTPQTSEKNKGSLEEKGKET